MPLMYSLRLDRCNPISISPARRPPVRRDFSAPRSSAIWRLPVADSSHTPQQAGLWRARRRVPLMCGGNPLGSRSLSSRPAIYPRRRAARIVSTICFDAGRSGGRGSPPLKPSRSSAAFSPGIPKPPLTDRAIGISLRCSTRASAFLFSRTSCTRRTHSSGRSDATARMRRRTPRTAIETGSWPNQPGP